MKSLYTEFIYLLCFMSIDYILNKSIKICYITMTNLIITTNNNNFSSKKFLKDSSIKF